MYNKPDIIDAREKVRYTILTCQNRNQLVIARQFARNFRKLYGLGLSIYILFPELLKQSRNLYLKSIYVNPMVNNCALFPTIRINEEDWETYRKEILTFTTPNI